MTRFVSPILNIAAIFANDIWSAAHFGYEALAV